MNPCLILIAMLSSSVARTDPPEDTRSLMLDFRARHPDPSKWTPEDFSQYSKLEASLPGGGSASAADRLERFLQVHPDREKWAPDDDAIFEQLSDEAKKEKAKLSKGSGANSQCDFADENLAYAVPGGVVWKENGHAAFPKNDHSVLSASDSGSGQTAVIQGGGVLFAQNAGASTKTSLSLSYKDDGLLQQLKLSSKSGLTETISYRNEGNGCSLKRVVVEGSPGLKGAKGVSFDENLCAELDKKGLLQDNRHQTCSDYSQQVGKAIDKFSALLPQDESFALFTSGPDGRVQLRKYRSHDYPATNEAIATDCALHWKPAALRTPGPNPFADVERGTSSGAAPAP